jgi:hypothetical protein
MLKQAVAVQNFVVVYPRNGQDTHEIPNLVLWASEAWSLDLKNKKQEFWPFRSAVQNVTATQNYSMNVCSLDLIYKPLYNEILLKGLGKNVNMTFKHIHYQCSNITVRVGMPYQ